LAASPLLALPLLPALPLLALPSPLVAQVVVTCSTQSNPSPQSLAA
jgi:hypothetical protein